MADYTPPDPYTKDDQRIAIRLAELRQQRNAILDDGALPLAITREEHASIVEQRAVLDRKIDTIETAAAACAALGSTEVDERWRDVLQTARDTLCAERMTIKSPIRDPHTKGVERNLHLSISCVDKGRQVFTDTGWELENSKLGELLRAAGYTVSRADPQRIYGGQLPWSGSLPEVERRIATLAQRRRVAQAALDEALLTDDERARRDTCATA